MQLPSSTVSSDPSAIPLPRPGAIAAEKGAGARSKPGATGGVPEFDRVFDDLVPEPDPAASAQLLENLSLIAICPPVDVSAPCAAGLTLLGEAGSADNESISTAEGLNADAAALPIASESPGRRITSWAGMRAPLVGRPAEQAVPFQDPESSEPESSGPELSEAESSDLKSSDERAVPEPNRHASETAFGTPRFAGLPEVALANRTPTKLPPGLIRLAAGPEVQPLPAAPAPVVTEPVDPCIQLSASAPNLPAVERPFGSPPIPLPGAAVHRPEEFGPEKEPARAAAEQPILETKPPGSAKGIPAALAPVLHGGGDVVSRVATQLGAQPASAEAKVAAAHDDDSSALELRSIMADKTFVDAKEDGFTHVAGVVGTATAKRAEVMFARFLPASAQHPAFEYAGTAAAVTTAPAEVPSPNQAAPAEAVGTAHEALEVVLRAVEQASAQGQKLVNLHFSIGHAALSVRIELRARDVRTTFRTESPELRAALSEEWQAIASSSPGERVRIVPAVFSASEHAAFNEFAGDTSSRSRDHGAHREAAHRSPIAISHARGTVTGAPERPIESATSAAVSLTAQHLYTLA